MSNLCPICQKDDQIQRVVAVVQAGHSSGTYSGPSHSVTYAGGKWGSVSGYSALSGSTVSDLARLLSPPAEPQKGKLNIIVWIAPIALVCNLLLLSPMLSSTQGVFFFLTLCVLALFAYFLLYNSQNKIKIQADNLYAVEKPAWDTAMEKWNRLYLCHRDGIVFDPKNGDSCQPTQINEFIFSNTG